MYKGSPSNIVAGFGGNTGGARKTRRGKKSNRTTKRRSRRSASRNSYSSSSSDFDLDDVLSGNKQSKLSRGLGHSAVLGDLMSKMSIMPSLSKGLLDINPIGSLSTPLSTSLFSGFGDLYSGRLGAVSGMSTGVPSTLPPINDDFMTTGMVSNALRSSGPIPSAPASSATLAAAKTGPSGSSGSPVSSELPIPPGPPGLPGTGSNPNFGGNDMLSALSNLNN